MKKMKGSTILLLVGILVFSVGCIGPFMYEDAIEKGYKVEATVTRIKEGTDIGTDGMPDSTVYTYYGEYEVDGKKYTDVKLGKSYDEKKYAVGSTMGVVVNPNNPGGTMSEGGVICTVGFVIMIIAVVQKFSERKKKKQKNQTPLGNGV